MRNNNTSQVEQSGQTSQSSTTRPSKSLTKVTSDSLTKGTSNSKKLTAHPFSIESNCESEKGILSKSPVIETSTDVSFIKSSMSLDSIPLPNVPTSSKSLGEIPLPGTMPAPESINTIRLPERTPQGSKSLENIPLPDTDNGSSQSFELGSLLKRLNALRPEEPDIIACPVSVKKEGRMPYDSRNRNSIRSWFVEEHGSNSDDTKDPENHIDEDIVVLTPPPLSPEPVVVLSTDSEDERNNINRPPRLKNAKKADTPIYSISSGSESDSSRRRSASRSRHRRSHTPSKRRRYHSRSRSIDRRHRSRRNRSRSRHRSHSRRRNLPNSRHRRSRTPVRRRRTPVKDRLGPRPSTEHHRNRHRRKDRSRTPRRRVSRTPNKQFSSSPLKRNGTRSPHRKRPVRYTMSKTRSKSPVRISKRKKTVSPLRSSTSPERLRKAYEKSRRRDIGAAVDATLLYGTSQTLASELERNYRRMHEEIEVVHENHASDVAEEGEIRNKTKKRSKTDNKKKKKKRSKNGENEFKGKHM